MRALTLVADRKLELLDVPEPPPPAAGEVQLRVKAIGLNHLDVWGWRGMAFAKRKLPLIVGVEAAGEIVAVGPSAAPPASATGAQVASRKLTPSGTGITSRAGMLSKSRAKPSAWKPITPETFSQRLSRPSRQALQVPQVSPP